jgi:Chaperone of endosialidase
MRPSSPTRWAKTSRASVECTVAADALANATAIGAHAVVGQSNSLVLGGMDQYAVMVGIGTTTPSNILTIGRGAGHPVSDSWETYSSRRWKKNIHPLDNALGKVEQLRGVSYDLKDSGKHEIGVIAEEVGQVVPEVVSYEDNGKDARGVDYSRLTALLIEAVKQQQREISVMRRQLQRRAAKEAALESRLEQLEQDRGETQLASAHPVH